MCDRWTGRTVGAVAPVTRIAALQAVWAEVPVLTATQAMGREWDATSVVGPRGWNGLYVALTRCTQELGRLRPDGFSWSGGAGAGS